MISWLIYDSVKIVIIIYYLIFKILDFIQIWDKIFCGLFIIIQLRIQIDLIFLINFRNSLIFKIWIIFNHIIEIRWFGFIFHGLRIINKSLSQMNWIRFENIKKNILLLLNWITLHKSDKWFFSTLNYVILRLFRNC